MWGHNIHGSGSHNSWRTLAGTRRRRCRDIGRTDIHGIQAGDVAVAPLFEEIAPDVAVRLRNAVVVGYHLRFDLTFLRSGVHAGRPVAADAARAVHARPGVQAPAGGAQSEARLLRPTGRRAPRGPTHRARRRPGDGAAPRRSSPRHNAWAVWTWPRSAASPSPSQPPSGRRAPQRESTRPRRRGHPPGGRALLSRPTRGGDARRRGAQSARGRVPSAN
jgi:hypothetical protein